jgi:hypothetical protein
MYPIVSANIREKMRNTIAIYLLLLSFLILLSGCSDGHSVINLENNSAIPKITMETSSMGLIIPDAINEYGLREYQYNEQKVVDWIGDFPNSDIMRYKLLTYVDAKVNKDSGSLWKDEYYYIFMGIPVRTVNGWLIPAGKRLDGEWIPEIFYLSNNESDIEIQCHTMLMDFWSINKGKLLKENKGITFYFGIVPCDARLAINEKNSSTLVLELVGSGGGQTQIIIPPYYPYFLYIQSDDEIISGLSIVDETSKEQLQVVLSDENGNYSVIGKNKIENAIQSNIRILDMSKVK